MLDKLVEIAQGIHQVLSQGTVKVAQAGGIPQMREPERETNDIALAPGMYGGGGW